MKLPIKAARDIAKEHGWDQVVIIARKTGDDGGEHAVTYGTDKAHCEVAARIGMALKHHLMQWPSALADSSVRVRGVSRDSENNKAVVVYLDNEVTDDALTLIHEFLQPQTHSPKQVAEGA